MFHSQTIAAADPTPFNKPRFIRWPSVCDTTRTNWLGPEEPDPAPPSPALQNHVEYACMYDPRTGQPIDPRVLAACTSVDCIAPTADPSLTFTAIAAPPVASPELYSTTICCPGAPLPQDPKPQPKQDRLRSQKTHKTGRPLVFDAVKRAELCAMVRTGCSLRNAAQNAGVKMSSIYYACRTDPVFDADLRRAEKDRDVRGIGRINNAGEKSWRATAWLLERASPKHFSLRGLNRTNSAVREKHLGGRRLKQLIAEALKDVLPTSLEAAARQPMIDAACRRINERLAEIESQGSRPFDPNDDDFNEELDEQFSDNQHEHGERNAVSPPIDSGERGAVSPPMNTGPGPAWPMNDKPDDDPAVEAAAQAAFQRILNFIHQP